MSAEELTAFIDELLSISPAVGAALEGDGEPLLPDMDRAVVPRTLVLPLLGAQSRAYLEAWDACTLGSDPDQR